MKSFLILPRAYLSADIFAVDSSIDPLVGPPRRHNQETGGILPRARTYWSWVTWKEEEDRARRENRCDARVTWEGMRQPSAILH